MQSSIKNNPNHIFLMKSIIQCNNKPWKALHSQDKNPHFPLEDL